MELTTEIIDMAARAAHEANRAYCVGIEDHSQLAWRDAPDWQRDSARKGVLAVFADPTMLPSAQHDSWLEEKRATGWAFGPVKNAEAKEHPCFVPYDDLPPEQKAKDAIFGAVVRGVLHHHGMIAL